MAPELNRTAVIGAGAGVVLVVLAYGQLRKTPAAIVVTGGSTDTGASDLSAYQAGAAAAGSGFDTGAALGQAGIGLAGSVVGSLSDVALGLAGSQADMGNTLAGALQDTIGAITTPTASPAPAPSPTPTPGGTPTPPGPAPWWPASLGTPPAGAIGYIVVGSGTLNTYSVSGTTATRQAGSISGGFTAYVNRLLSVTLTGGGSTRLVHLASGKYSGRWIGQSRGAWHPKP